VNERRPATICILGGGTAGWMAANLFQYRWGPSGTKVTLIESSEIGIVGVGEGSTPQLKAFFDGIGIAEHEWMPRCHATYKTGIEFLGWSDREGYSSYFHPFTSDVDVHTAPQFFYNARARRNGMDVPAHPDRFFLSTALAHRGLAPLPPPNFPFVASYGYHFDARLVGGYLRDVAAKRGVEHIDARIADVELTPEGNVAALLASDGRRFEAELFIDASGFRSVILEGALGEPHRAFAENLFNDSAVVVQTPAPADGPDNCTRSFAKSAGWIWQIPLTNRVGNGYVYSSRYIDRDAAAAELREHFGLAPDAEVRHLSMRVGRMERSWVANCLAIGLAQGFLEPLEATALHIVLATVEGFIRTVDECGMGGDAQAQFNETIARRYEGIRDYVVCHYRTALRRDTDYWRAATKHDHLSDSLKGIITAWFTGRDMAEEVARQDIARYYTAISWQCMLAGYGNFPDPGRLRPPPAGAQGVNMNAVDRFIDGCAMNFPAHRVALQQLEEAV
jgi:2-polyprenyl-6-methoxyphenol hydroxylase-like FAD-dependent oxidoreductase